MKVISLAMRTGLVGVGRPERVLTITVNEPNAATSRTARRYVLGEAKVPPAHVLLLRAMVELGCKPVVPRKTRRQY